VVLTALLIKIKVLWGMTWNTLKIETASSSETSVTNYQSKLLIYQKISIFIVLHVAETGDLITAKYLSIIVQRDATQSSLFIILQVHSTCFGCQPHSSSGVHKTANTVSGTVQLPPSNVAKLGHVGGR